MRLKVPLEPIELLLVFGSSRFSVIETKKLLLKGEKKWMLCSERICNSRASGANVTLSPFALNQEA